MHQTKPSTSNADVVAGVKDGFGPSLGLLPPLILLLTCLAGFGLTFASSDLLFYQEITTLRLLFLLGMILLAVQTVLAWRVSMNRDGILPQAVVSSLLLTGVAAGVELWRAATLAV